MLYTRKGDAGTSGLFGTKERYPKDSPVYDALGGLDELNSLLGFCRATAQKSVGLGEDIPSILRNVQEHLFVAQAELAGADKALTQKQVGWLEEVTDRLEALAGNPHAFVLPGATPLSGLLHYARTVARRAERAVIRAREIRAMSAPAYAYLNRLSSLLYALARYAAAGTTELSPSY